MPVTDDVARAEGPLNLPLHRITLAVTCSFHVHFRRNRETSGQFLSPPTARWASIGGNKAVSFSPYSALFLRLRR